MKFDDPRADGQSRPPFHALRRKAHARTIVRMSTSDRALRIRDATEKDISAIWDIYCDTVVNSVATLDTEPPSLERQTEWFRRHGGRFPVLVAEHDGAIFGWASLSVWNDRGAYLYTSEASVYVAADYRRQGIGMLLMRALIERAQELDYHVIIARVVSTNETSLSMMRGLGFRDVGTIHEVGWKFGQWLDMCVLQFSLPAGGGRTDSTPHDLAAPHP